MRSGARYCPHPHPNHPLPHYHPPTHPHPHLSNMLTIVHKAVVSKSQARLTHISFNLAHPVIITGDNKGQVVIS